MIMFKSCPKCSTGDLIKTTDLFGEYLECVQCGFVRDLAEPAVQRAEAPQPFAGWQQDQPQWSA